MRQSPCLKYVAEVDFTATHVELAIHSSDIVELSGCNGVELSI